MRGRIGFVFVLLFPALFAGEFFAALDLLFGSDLRPLLGYLRFDHIDFIADVDAIGHRFFVAVVADYILFEEAVGTVVRRDGEADRNAIEFYSQKNTTQRALLMQRW